MCHWDLSNEVKFTSTNGLELETFLKELQKSSLWFGGGGGGSWMGWAKKKDNSS